MRSLQHSVLGCSQHSAQSWCGPTAYLPASHFVGPKYGLSCHGPLIVPKIIYLVNTEILREGSTYHVLIKNDVGDTVGVAFVNSATTKFHKNLVGFDIPDSYSEFMKCVSFLEIIIVFVKYLKSVFDPTATWFPRTTKAMPASTLIFFFIPFVAFLARVLFLLLLLPLRAALPLRPPFTSALSASSSISIFLKVRLWHEEV